MPHFIKIAKPSILLILVLPFCAFNWVKPDKKTSYLFKLGDKEYYDDAFRYYFFKNNDGLSADSIAHKVEEYLPLYINFRLKVLEAINLGMDKDQAFREEFNTYKSQLAEPYLTESKITESLLKETYQRMQEERSAAHILIGVGPDALPTDTLAAYNRLLSLKKRILAGEQFDSLAYRYSEDPSAKANYGNLGYFSAMQMVFPFEEATFTTPVGQLAGPVRTRFGYHLIQVNDSRPARGKVLAAHIMIRSAGRGDQAAHKKVLSVHQKLMEGEDWDALCKIHSEDPGTSSKGGKLNWFGTGNIVKEFEDAAFALDSIGGISPPVKTRYGWHIIKLLDKKGLEPFETIKPKLEQSLARDARSRVKKQKALAAIKKQHGFVRDSTAKAIALEAIDNTLLQGSWLPDSSHSSANIRLLTLGSRQKNVIEFWQYVQENQTKRIDTPLEVYKNELYNRFEEKSIFEFEEDYLAETNFDYKMILEEYKSGILLFNLMEKNVWQKAVEDSLGQIAFYEKTKANYKRNETASVRFFSSENKATVDKAIDFVEASKKEIDAAFNTVEPLNLQVTEKTLEKGSGDLAEQYWQEGTHFFEEDGRYYLVYVKEIVPAGIKPFEKTRGAVIAAYQEQLEQNWIEQLKKKYPVKVSKRTLKKTIAKIEDEV